VEGGGGEFRVPPLLLVTGVDFCPLAARMHSHPSFVCRKTCKKSIVKTDKFVNVYVKAYIIIRIVRPQSRRRSTQCSGRPSAPHAAERWRSDLNWVSRVERFPKRLFHFENHLDGQWTFLRTNTCELKCPYTEISWRYTWAIVYNTVWCSNCQPTSTGQLQISKYNLPRVIGRCSFPAYDRPCAHKNVHDVLSCRRQYIWACARPAFLAAETANLTNKLRAEWFLIRDWIVNFVQK